MTVTLPSTTRESLSLRTPRLPVVEAAAIELLVTEIAQDQLADALHDGAVQALVSARWAIDSGDAGLAREAVQAALVELRHTLWHLRPRGDDLPAALEQLAARPARPRPLTLLLDHEAQTTPAGAAAAYRFVQHLTTSPDGPLTVTLSGRPDVVVLDLSDTPMPDSPWAERFAALGGALMTFSTDLRLILPRAAPTAKATS